MLNTMPMLGRFPRSVWIFRSLWVFGVGVLVATAGLLAYGVYLATFLELPRSEDHPPLRLYTAPFPLKTGLSLKTARLPERLQRLGYRPVNDAVASPGDYRLTTETLTIFLHAQPEAFVKANVVALELQDNLVTQVVSEPDRTPIFPVFLEPELISGLRGASRQVREWIPLARIPERLVDTVLAVEDRRFFSHAAFVRGVPEDEPDAVRLSRTAGDAEPFVAVETAAQLEFGLTRVRGPSWNERIPDLILKIDVFRVRYGDRGWLVVAPEFLTQLLLLRSLYRQRVEKRPGGFRQAECNATRSIDILDPFLIVDDQNGRRDGVENFIRGPL